MASVRVAGVLIAAVCVVVVCESAALGQAQTTTLPIVIDEFPGPCRYINATYTELSVNKFLAL